MGTIIVFFQRINVESTPQFRMFSMTHFIVIIISVIIFYIIYKYSSNIKGWKYEKILRYILGAMMIYTNINLLIYSFNLGESWYKYLPIATCGYATFFGGLTLITKNKVFFKLTLFWGFGAILSLLGPTILEGPQRYNFYQFFFRHLGIVVIPIYMIKVHNYKITSEDWKLFFYVTISLTIVSTIINLAINNPNELNMFYTMQPAIGGTPLSYLYDVSRLYYVAFWIPFAAFMGYLYGLPFYTKEELFSIE